MVLLGPVIKISLLVVLFQRYGNPLHDLQRPPIKAFEEAIHHQSEIASITHRRL